MRGFTTMISTIVIGAIGVALVSSVLILGSVATHTSSVLERSQSAKQIANACGEVALQVLHDNFTYSGTGNISLGEGSCTYTVTVGSGENRTINISANAGNSTRKIQIDVSQLTGSILKTWKEIP